MMKFSALNESSLSDEDGDPELATREAQEEEAYSLYHSALRKQVEGNITESEELFKEILEHEFLLQVQPRDEKSTAPLGPALTLKYLVYKNLAALAHDKKDFQASVSYYLEALEIDSTDVMMWYRMGKVSLNISNYALARLCFEEGLKYNPNHWPCLDNVITVMYTLNDYANCLYYIALALERESSYLKGLAFKDQIYKEDPSLKSFCENYFNKCDPSIHFADYDKEEADKFIQESLDMREKKRSFYKPTPLPVIGLGRPIEEFTWKDLGESLVNVYDCIDRADPAVSYSCKIDLSPYLPSMKLPSSVTEKPVSSPISSSSDALSSSSALQSTTTVSQSSEQNGATPLPMTENQGANEIVMKLVEVPNAANTPPPQTLVLPQIEIQNSDVSTLGDSTPGRRKRKRNELSELRDFVSKRRSTRVRNPAVRRPQDNTNYQELLHKFLPSKLIRDGRFDEQDYDSDPISQDKSNSEHMFGCFSGKTDSDVNISSTEKEEICDFIAKNQENAGIVDLLYRYVTILGSKFEFIWPKALSEVYCSAFSRLRKHITTPNLFSSSTESCRIREVGLAVLVYCEFKVDKWYQSSGNSVPFSSKVPTSSFHSEEIGLEFHSDLEYLAHLTSRRDVFLKDWLCVSGRVFWMKSKFHSLEGEIELAVCCMARLSDILYDETEKGFKIVVPNCSFSNLISADNVVQQLESLQRCQSLEEVQRLYEHGDYTAVINLLILTFNQPRTKRKQSIDGVPERHAQLLLLQNSLLKLERYKECIYWTEMSFNEALQQFMNATKNAEWSETMAQLLSGLEKCAKLDPSYLSELEESKLVRLTQNLILVIVIQMESYDFAGDNAALLVVLPWIILYRLILNEEKRSKSKTSNNAESENNAASQRAISSNLFIDFDLNSAMPSSLMLLFTAHEYLGRRAWCTISDGLLLLTIIDIMMNELQNNTGNTYLYREDLETGLEQCIYCLYGHPNKRSRAKHLQEHNARQITMTWERANLIFKYFRPNILPEFDSYRTSTISAELECLFKRISTMVPPDEEPTARIDSYTAYIEGANKCPDPPFKNKKLSIVVRDLYYLLGDYYFKNKEFGKAIRFYLCDICINPDRQDSWAGMALSRSSQLDQKLNSYELRNESTIYRKSSAALRCFEHALELDPTTTSLWIEYGSLAYILHSHASRQLKQENFSDEMLDLLKKKRGEMLDVAERCFRAANHTEDGSEPEEAWLHHYMLGKICEKKNGKPAIFLEHYRKALAYLHEDFARYPQKILYHNPADLSIEVLEVYYRTHASCLKFLWKNENTGIDLATVKVIQQTLHAIKASPFYNFQEKSKNENLVTSHVALEIEEPLIKLPESQSKDHNYSDLDKNTKKISEGARSNRPSTDSLPESLDLICIKEILDSLVGVVAEKFIDEAKERHVENVVAEQDAGKLESKIVIESIAEESVYTTKSPNENYNSVKNSPCSVAEPMIIEENDDFAKLQELAKELESKAAAYKIQAAEKSEKEQFNLESSSTVEKSENITSAHANLAMEEKSVSAENVGQNKEEDVLQSLSSILNILERASKSVIDSTHKSQTEVESGTVLKNEEIYKEVDKILEDISLTTENNVILESKPQNVNKLESVVMEEMECDLSDSNKKCETPKEVFVSDKKDTNADTELEVVKIASNSENDNAEISKSTSSDESKNSSSDKYDVQTNENKMPSTNSTVQLKTMESVPIQPTAEELLKSKAEIAKLIPKCLDAMRECLRRFIQHYKALYRIAHYYCHSIPNKNLQSAREILLAATPATKKYESLPGLFAERKNTNLFNGIWRAPSNEIDRPGSFGAHMYRSVLLLIEVLTAQKDYNMLVYLTQQLYRTPDLGKKYMRDTDRVFLLRKSFDSVVNILRDQMNMLLQEEPPPEESRLICCLLEIFRTCSTLWKSGINIEDTNDLLEESYTMYKLGEVDSHPSVLDQAIKFCQLQLGKTYPQLESVKTASPPTTSKYIPMADPSTSFSNASVPSASGFSPDAWQKGKRA